MSEKKSQPITAPVYDATGAKTGTVDLDVAVFGVTPKQAVLWEASRVQMANRRKVLAHTKTKAEVRGGGKKPWKQKGTGRARQGSTRNPQWAGGGVAFGPRKDRNFSLKINTKVRQLALRMALSDRAAHERVAVLAGLSSTELKTKQLSAALEKMQMQRKLVLVVPAGSAAVLRAARNLDFVRTIGAGSLNVLDVLGAHHLVVLQEALPTVVATYAKK